MKLLVTGGRTYNNYMMIDRTLREINHQRPIELLIHGGAPGADTLTAMCAKSMGIHVCAVNALWDYYDNSAGFIRNSKMLLLNPDMCVAFPGGKGTKGMVDLCRRNDVHVHEVMV